MARPPKSGEISVQIHPTIWTSIFEPKPVSGPTIIVAVRIEHGQNSPSELSQIIWNESRLVFWVHLDYSPGIQEESLTLSFIRLECLINW